MARKRQTHPGPYVQRIKLMREHIKKPQTFPYTLTVFRDLDELTFHDQVTFFVGENGSGKSTLLEGIAGACGLNPEGGSRNFNFATRASHSNLDECLRLVRYPATPSDMYFLRAESFYNVATQIEKYDEEGMGLRIIDAYGGQSLHEQSHGESFFALFKNRFRAKGLYLLDEPEAALSPKRQLEFLALLHQYVQGGCQFMIATHSPIILAYPHALIYHFSAAGLREIGYTDTEHYLITRGFLSNPRRMLSELGIDDVKQAGEV